ncbi:MAG: zf-HC2 domain-containing protein [Chloroflexota bacterium]
MTELTHDQARRHLHAAADGNLSAEGRAALNAHLDACPKCQAYAAEFNRLQSALYRAWHTRWRARHSLADMPARVLSSARRAVERKLFLSFANAVAQAGTILVVAMFVMGIFQNQSVRFDNQAGTSAAGASVSTRFGGNLPAFELEANDGSPLLISRYSSEEDRQEPVVLPGGTNSTVPIMQ